MAGFDDICGERVLVAIRTDVHHPFCHGANGCALDLDGTVVFVFEDPEDGYRSSATVPLICNGSLYQFGVSPDYIRAPVLIRRWTKGAYGEDADGIEIIDRRNGKTILRLGTDHSDDYYPLFTCEWRPEDLAERMRT